MTIDSKIKVGLLNVLLENKNGNEKFMEKCTLLLISNMFTVLCNRFISCNVVSNFENDQFLCR